jgi:hypothetical protein
MGQHRADESGDHGGQLLRPGRKAGGGPEAGARDRPEQPLRQAGQHHRRELRRAGDETADRGHADEQLPT